ncbi:hypothetical protein C8J56DRAFT_1067733 [Mycena floridula]|nr:hypothetical protein C8J56DRAFT_1067733 [Mycena floridula]
MTSEDIYKISGIKVINNRRYPGILRLVTGAGNVYSLSPKVGAGQTIIFDLTKVQDLKNGDTFQVKFVCDDGGMVIDQTQFTYDKDSKNQAIFVITGTPNAPLISFSNLASIE